MGKASRRRKNTPAPAAVTPSRQDTRRRDIVRILTAVVIAGVLGGVISVAALSKGSGLPGESSSTAANADPDAALPAGVLPAGSDYEYGVPAGDPAPANPASTLADGVPVVEVWEDFQCPGCQIFATSTGASTLDLLDQQGIITLIHRPTTFLDTSLSNDSSSRATNAYGCALDAGVGDDYRKAVFTGAPEEEGDGWSDTQLVDFASSVGITGAALDTFTTCVTTRPYAGWADNTTAAFYASGVTSTPSVLVDGTVVPLETVNDPAAFTALLNDTP